MNELPENELLSAYLDGELTADEHAQVEQWLAGSPAARQLLEEMRALRATLQALPAYKLDEDLSQRVLRLAERRMLEEPVQPVAAAPQPASVSSWSLGRRLRQPRVWLWPAAAVAMAVALWIRGQEGIDLNRGRELARAPEAAERPAEAPKEPPSIQAPEERAPRSTELGRIVDEKRAADFDRSPKAGEAADELREGQAGSRVTEVAPAARPERLFKEGPGGMERKLAEDLRAKKAEPPPAASPASQAAPGVEPLMAEREAPEAELTEESRFAGRPAKGRGAPGAAGDSQGRGAPARTTPPPTMALKAKAADRQEAAAALPQVYVLVEMTPEAAGKQAFQHLLASRRLDQLNQQQPLEVRPQAGWKGQTVQRPGKAPDAYAHAAQDKAEMAQQDASAARPGVQHLEWVATGEEIQALLRELKARPDQFVSVAELPVADAEAMMGGGGGIRKADNGVSYHGGQGGQLHQGQDRAENRQAPVEEMAKQLPSQAPSSGPVPAEQQLQLPADDIIGYPGQEPRSRARSQVRAQIPRGDTTMAQQARAVDPRATTYRVVFELQIVAQSSFAAEPPHAAKSAAAARETVPAAPPPAAAPPAEAEKR